MIRSLRPLAAIALLGAVVLPHGADAADIPSRAEPIIPMLPQPPVPTGGPYFATRTGLSVIDDTAFRLGGGAVTVDTEYENGIFNSFALGYAFSPLFGAVSPRLEVEAFFGDFSVDRHVVNGLAVDSIDSFGELQAFGGFANAYLDIDLGPAFGSAGLFAAVKPFVGAGIGLANVELKKQGVSATGTVISDDDTAFAYQLSAGIGVDLGRLGFGGAVFDRSTLDIGYRFLHAPDLDFTARDGTRSSTDLTANMVTIGFRRRF